TSDRRFLKTFLPDEEGAPWMPITDWHMLALIAALLPLRWYAEVAHPEWYVGSEMAVYFPIEDGRNFVAPDLFVALAHRHPRYSFDSQEEGGFPAFVLEIISRESQKRDTTDKVRLYDLVQAREYVIFDAEDRLRPRLQGYHRNERGQWTPWAPGSRGELHSSILGLTLVADGDLLRFEDAAGNRLLTADEERQRAERESLTARQARARADQEQARAEQQQARAEQQQARAEQERARAEAAEEKIAGLQALLRQLQPPE
ncbi:MAG TPA: Uma2 family endonuclease, partial [Chloroflexota bacterium]|nr:Uma2 family endonuclease [Chloroflexota bacterium]